MFFLLLFAKDHPRVCGKDKANCLRKENRIGSPPRMRERPVKVVVDAFDEGITPAYAGKTVVALLA